MTVVGTTDIAKLKKELTEILKDIEDGKTPLEIHWRIHIGKSMDQLLKPNAMDAYMFANGFRITMAGGIIPERHWSKYGFTFQVAHGEFERQLRNPRGYDDMIENFVKKRYEFLSQEKINELFPIKNL